MGRFHAYDEIHTAMFVDFDNIFSRMMDQDQTLARIFATHPQRWLRWLETHAIRMMYGENVRRRIIKRICYLTPQRFHEFKPYFSRTGFHVVECSCTSSGNKNNAAIHIALDCLDALGHSTHFDEFIILSGDSDLTPLLLRIQEHARKTLVLSIGYTNPAFSSACSWRVREDWFLSQALEDQRIEEGEHTDKHYESKDNREERSAPEERRVFFDKRSETGKIVKIQLSAARRIRLIESVKQLVSESSVPVPLPSIAHVLQHEHEATPDWFGAGTLRDLLQALDLAPITFSSLGQGFVFDPARQERPENTSIRAAFKSASPELYDFALKANQLIDVPLIKPEHYKKLFSLLVEEIQAHSFSRSGSIPLLRERCEEEGLPVTAEQIAFIVDAVSAAGYPLSRVKSKATVADTTQAFASRVEELCRLSSMPFGPAEQKLLTDWFVFQ